MRCVMRDACHEMNCVQPIEFYRYWYLLFLSECILSIRNLRGTFIVYLKSPFSTSENVPWPTQGIQRHFCLQQNALFTKEFRAIEWTWATNCDSPTKRTHFDGECLLDEHGAIRESSKNCKHIHICVTYDFRQS